MVDCNNAIYVRNLVTGLAEAKKREDIDRIIVYASELERYKILCGYTPAIRQLEEAMERTANELGLSHHEQIERSLQPPLEEKICPKCSMHAYKEPPQERTPLGFSGMLQSVFPSPKEEKHPQPLRRFMSGFQQMIEAATCRGRQNMMNTISRGLDSNSQRDFGRGIRGMLDAISRNVEPKAPKKQKTYGITYRGFNKYVVDLQTGRLYPPLEEPKQQPIVERGFGRGFRGMLDEAFGS